MGLKQPQAGLRCQEAFYHAGSRGQSLQVSFLITHTLRQYTGAGASLVWFVLERSGHRALHRASPSTLSFCSAPMRAIAPVNKPTGKERCFEFGRKLSPLGGNQLL